MLTSVTNLLVRCKADVRNFLKKKTNLETNDNENTMIQNRWDAAKAVLRGKFIAIRAYLKKQEKSQINNLTLQLKEQEKKPEKQLNEVEIGNLH